MTQPVNECDELRITIERLRTLLENLVVRGLRACGADELGQLASFTQDLERAGAGHVASVLATLHAQIEKDDRASAQTLLKAQTSVRLLERLLTLRVVRGQFQTAAAMAQGGVGATAADSDDQGDEEEEEE
jgi:hypothetical protein